MTRWFRFYDDALNDPKVQRLAGDDFKAWVNLLCLASKNDGQFPPLSDMAFALRMAEGSVKSLLEGFARVELVDEVEGCFRPHNWNERQYKSDVSNERVKRFRNGQRNVTETVNETPPETEQIRAEQTQTRARDPWIQFRIEAVQTAEKHNSLPAHNSVDLIDRWKANGFPLDMCRAVLLPGIAKKPDKTLHYWGAVIEGEMAKKNPAANNETQAERESRWEKLIRERDALRPRPYRTPPEIPAEFVRLIQDQIDLDIPPFLDRRAQA